MNKMFKKLMAVSATVAIAATMSVSAFAETKATHEDGTVSVSGYEPVANAVQYTVMVFKVADDTADFEAATPAKVDDIYYINQGTELYDVENKDGLLDQMLVKATDGENALPKGTYVVRIGNDKGVPTSLGLSIEGDAPIVYGDANGDGLVNRNDMLLLLQYFGRVPNITVDTVAANCNGDEIFNRNDLLHILKYFGRVPGIVLGPQSTN